MGIRTPGLLHAMHTPNVAGCGWTSPGVAFTCGFRGWTWPGVAALCASALLTVALYHGSGRFLASAGSDREELYLDADGISDAGQVAGIAGDDRGLVLDRGHDDDGIDHVRGAGRRAGNSGRTADPLIIGENAGALQDTGDLVLRPAAPGLRQHDNRHDRADPCPGHLIMQGQEIRIAALGCQQRPGVIDDRAHYPAANWVSSSSNPVSARNWRARCRDAAGSGPCSDSYPAISSRAAARPAACRAAARAFSVAASASQADTGLPSPAAAALIVASTSAGTEIDSFRTVIRPS